VIRKHQKFWMLICPWVVWACAVTFYSHQYFLRVSVSSLSPNLVSHFHINAMTLAGVAASFYYAFMAMQLISGILLDRFGPQIMLPLAAFLCGIGAILFALAPNVAFLEFSRIIIGAAASFAFIGVLTLCRLWFPASQFALLNGITMSVGTFGAFLGEGPLADLLNIINWREIILFAGAFAILLSVLIWFVMRDCKPQINPDEKPHSFHDIFGNLPKLLRMRTVWLAGSYACFIFAPVSAFAALWCGPFMVTRYHVSLTVAETASSMVFIGVGVGAPMLATLTKTLNSVTIMRLAAIGAVLMISTVIYMNVYPLGLMMVVLFLLGAFVSAFSLAFVVVGERIDDEMAATAFSLTNFMKLLGGAILLYVIGYILDLHVGDHQAIKAGHYSLTDYRTALMVLPISLALAFGVSLFIKSKK